MKRWALLVAMLYVAMLAVLALPLVLAAFAPEFKPAGVAMFYLRWQAWLLPGLMGLAQLTLLAVPVRVASRRPLTRRPLAFTVLTAALMMGLLGLGAFLSIYEFGFHEQGGPWTLWTAGGLGLAGWIGWAILFHRLSRRVEPEDLAARLCGWLLKGSILELLIAVPTHIVARCRDYCCAGFMTFIGLTLGISVMLLSFGPGVFFLFAARWRRLHPEVDRGD